MSRIAAGAAFLACMAAATPAMPRTEQTRLYDDRGRSAGRVERDTGGTRGRFYNERGARTGTFERSGGVTRFYDGRGKKIGEARR